MARYFKEQDIDEFRECFYLFARSGQITSLDELTVVMRSLGMSPTIQELTGYLKGKGGKMSFADFLEVMHIHSRAENLPHEKFARQLGCCLCQPQRVGWGQSGHMLCPSAWREGQADGRFGEGGRVCRPTQCLASNWMMSTHITHHGEVQTQMKEVVNAFKAGDNDKRGVIPAKQLRNLLQNWGEGLSSREIDNIFREANVQNNGIVRYEDFVKISCAPVPDYY